jgi:hypothetical protein
LNTYYCGLKWFFHIWTCTTSLVLKVRETAGYFVCNVDQLLRLTVYRCYVLKKNKGNISRKKTLLRFCWPLKCIYAHVHIWKNVYSSAYPRRWVVTCWRLWSIRKIVRSSVILLLLLCLYIKYGIHVGFFFFYSNVSL